MYSTFCNATCEKYNFVFDDEDRSLQGCRVLHICQNTILTQVKDKLLTLQPFKLDSSQTFGMTEIA